LVDLEIRKNGTRSLFPKRFWWHDRDMPKTLAAEGFSLAIEYYREEDGRWLADIAALPGVTAYGRTKKQATAAVQALALRLIADRLEHGEALSGPMNVSFIAA
jgi:predicted RNase H-like HicB family nuclease